MNVRMFVTGTASLLAVWLGVTFFTKLPATDAAQRGIEGYVNADKDAPTVEGTTEGLVHQPENDTTPVVPVAVTQ